MKLSSEKEAGNRRPMNPTLTSRGDNARPSPNPAHVSASEADEWDDFVGKNTQGFHEQLSAYAVNRSAYGFEVDRVIVRERDEGSPIVGGAQVLMKSTPLGKFAMVQRGPLAANDDAAILAEVVRELDGFADRHSCASIRIDLLPTQTAAMSVLKQSGFQPSEAWAASMRSSVVSIPDTDADILQQMRRKTRYCVRRSMQCGVRTRIGDAASINEFYALREASAAHHRSVCFPEEYYRAAWRAFHKHDRACMFFADYERRPIAAVINVVAGGHLYYMWAGMDRDVDQQKIMACYLLQYEALRWGRERRCKLYDMVGVSTFKKKFATAEIGWPQSLRKHYGLLAPVRSRAVDWAWATPITRRAGHKLAGWLALRPRMPW